MLNIPQERIDQFWKDLIEEVKQDDELRWKLQAALITDLIHTQDHLTKSQTKTLYLWHRKWANGDSRKYLEMINNCEVPPIEIRSNSHPRDYEQCYIDGKKSYRLKDTTTFYGKLLKWLGR